APAARRLRVPGVRRAARGLDLPASHDRGHLEAVMTKEQAMSDEQQQSENTAAAEQQPPARETLAQANARAEKIEVELAQAKALRDVVERAQKAAAELKALERPLDVRGLSKQDYAERKRQLRGELREAERSARAAAADARVAAALTDVRK